MNTDIENFDLEVIDDINSDDTDIKSVLQNVFITEIKKEPNKLLKVVFAGLAAVGITGFLIY